MKREGIYQTGRIMCTHITGICREVHEGVMIDGDGVLRGKKEATFLVFFSLVDELCDRLFVNAIVGRE